MGGGLSQWLKAADVSTGSGGLMVFGMAQIFSGLQIADSLAGSRTSNHQKSENFTSGRSPLKEPKAGRLSFTGGSLSCSDQLRPTKPNACTHGSGNGNGMERMANEAKPINQARSRLLREGQRGRKDPGKAVLPRGFSVLDRMGFKFRHQMPNT